MADTRMLVRRKSRIYLKEKKLLLCSSIEWCDIANPWFMSKIHFVDAAFGLLIGPRNHGIRYSGEENKKEVITHITIMTDVPCQADLHDIRNRRGRHAQT